MEEGLPKVPKLELAQFKFALTQELSNKTKQSSKTSSVNQSIRDNLLAEIVKDSMSISILHSSLKYQT